MATKKAANQPVAWRFYDNAKPVHNRNADSKHVGDEPTYPDFEIQNKWTSEQYRGQLIRALNWYSQTQDRKQALEWAVQFLSKNPRRQQFVSALKKGDVNMPTNIGFLLRAARVGLKLRTSTLKRVVQDLNFKVTVNTKVTETTEEIKDTRAQFTIQDRLRERAQECMGEIEGCYDDFILGGFKEEPATIGLLTQYNIQPAQIKLFQDQANRHCKQLEEVIAGKDSQLVEGYKNYGKRELKAMLGFWQKVQEQLSSYNIIKKANKAPRKKKPLSPEKVVSKLKFCKEFAELKLKSIDATLVLQAEELWVYNTKTRKLGIYVADSHAGGKLNVKNSSITGFSEAQSMQKTLRKPEAQLKEFSANGKPAAKKWFKTVKSVETKLNGRINPDVILLKAFK